jgi:flagellar basal-body rod protein FlgB
MSGLLDNYFATSAMSMQAKNKRLELISENIANVSTPGYKSRDLDFVAFMNQAQSGLESAYWRQQEHGFVRQCDYLLPTAKPELR